VYIDDANPAISIAPSLSGTSDSFAVIARNKLLHFRHPFPSDSRGGGGAAKTANPNISTNKSFLSS
jgi:hypothetical protein